MIRHRFVRANPGHPAPGFFFSGPDFASQHPHTGKIGLASGKDTATIPRMFVELITTGSELLLGATLNSHQQWLGRRLADLGLPVCRQLTVPDAGTAIADAVADAFTRADLVITTGGLGPTSDDRTRSEIARLLGVPLVHDAAVARQIEHAFARRNRPVPVSSLVQAEVPAGARVLVNEHGSAPGLALAFPRLGQNSPAGLLIMLPGPPRELQPMFDASVVPLLREKFPVCEEFVSVTLQTIGIGESRVEEAIRPRLDKLVTAGLEIGFCARSGEVDVRLSATGESARVCVGEAVAVVRRLLGKFIYSDARLSLEEVVVGELRRQRKKLAIAESCTGGLLSSCITDVPGASEVFVGGVIAYSNQLKERLLGVEPATLARHGAVSEATVREMAAGARLRHGGDFALAITGIAGPTGGTPEKPVGTVFIGLAHDAGVEVRQELNALDRATFKWISTRQALDLLRRVLFGLPLPSK
ncbi:MAG TPA: competence/damage-inducible protein A [Verrucomicrobiales bacterium]|nr:competence/damage-inducible protein A [Verrucomicrobiales bacterium]